jgi:alpha-beta hydrolase superfamily lysophospholipase
LAEASACTIAEHTASDGYPWRYRRYLPGGAPRAEVVCLHGIQSHGGWYEHSCRRMQDAGYAVSFLDRRGSGLNEQDRGDVRGGFRRLLLDVAEYLRGLGERRGVSPPVLDAAGDSMPHRRADAAPLAGAGIPTFLVAISWGGKLGAALQRRHPGLVDGLALLCPGFFPKVHPPFRERLAIVCSRLVAPRRPFPVPLNDPALFTASPRWQQFIRDDPLALRRATARLLLESARLGGYLSLVPKWVRLPVLLLLAGQDRIINNERTRCFVCRFATTDRQVIEYPEAHHTLEFEPDPDRHLGDLLAWLDRQSGR